MEDKESTAKDFSLGVLFIHGIGTQKRGQTLSEFGGPLVRWLQARCEALALSRQQSGIPLDIIRRSRQQLEDIEWAGISRCHCAQSNVSSDTLAHRVVLREAKFHDPSDLTAPAHAVVTILSGHPDESVSMDNWLLAESWWAETFYPPSFDDVAYWCFRIVPWIVGSHFGAQVQRRLSERPKHRSVHDIWALSGWTWRLAAAIGGLAFGLLSTVVTMPLLTIILIVGAIPVPKIRSMLLHLQLQLDATLGDCYVLLMRQIEASSIVNRVRQDLLWLATRCSEVAIVAHSQGGAVAHLALRSSIAPELRLVFTFGSGLRKLGEAAQLIENASSFALSSVLTSIALIILFLCCGLLAMIAVGATPASTASILTLVMYVIGTGAVCVFGVRDHLRGIRLPEVERWVQWLTKMPLKWVDCYASADPVPNGPMVPPAKYQREVCNRSSMLTDHTTYWKNMDEFVSLLYEEIAQSRTYDAIPDLRLGEKRLKQVARRRRWRVAFGRFIWWAGATGVVVAIARRWLGWLGFASWAWIRERGLLSNVFGLQATLAPRPSVDWMAVGLLAAVLLTYSAARWLWASWNERKMKEALGLPAKKDSLGISREVWVVSSAWLLLLLIAGLIAGGVPSFWVWMLCLVPCAAFVAFERTDVSPPSSDVNEPEQTSEVGGLVSVVIGFATGAVLPFSLGLSAWEGLVWLTAHLSHGSFAGFRPDSISSFAAGAVAVIGWFVWLAISVIGTTRRREPATPPGD
jgi:hypothetical protein